MFLILRVKFLGELSTIGCKFMAFIGIISDTKSEILSCLLDVHQIGSPSAC